MSYDLREVNGFPRYLYHMTSMDALKNIIKNNEFWINNIRNMNDLYEISDIIEAEEDRKMNDIILSNIFIASFTYLDGLSDIEEKGQLWAYYSGGKPNKGVSIKFKKYNVEGLAKGVEVYAKEQSTYDYSYGYIEYLSFDKLERKISFHKEILQKYYEDRERKKLFDFIDSRLFYKMNCWSHENEYRIVLTDIKAIEKGLENKDIYTNNDRKLKYGSILSCFEEIIFGNLVEIEEIKEVIALLNMVDDERMHLKLCLAKNPYKKNIDKLQLKKEKLINKYNENVKEEKVNARYMGYYSEYNKKLK